MIARTLGLWLTRIAESVVTTAVMLWAILVLTAWACEIGTVLSLVIATGTIALLAIVARAVLLNRRRRPARED